MAPGRCFDSGVLGAAGTGRLCDCAKMEAENLPKRNQAGGPSKSGVSAGAVYGPVALLCEAVGWKRLQIPGSGDLGGEVRGRAFPAVSKSDRCDSAERLQRRRDHVHGTTGDGGCGP